MFIGLKEQPKDMLVAVDIIPDLVPEEDIFDTVEESFEYLRKRLKEMEPLA